MQMALTIARWLVRITGVLALILGLLFWSGTALSQIPVHMLLGLVLVLSLWVLAVLAVQAGLPIGMAAGVALVASGMAGGKGRLQLAGVLICAVSLFLGLTVAVATSHPLW